MAFMAYQGKVRILRQGYLAHLFTTFPNKFNIKRGFNRLENPDKLEALDYKGFKFDY